MDEYLRDFVQESDENITELNNALLELERDPEDDAAMDRIFRMAHTLKGNAGAMGFDEASNLAHAVEDLLEAVRSGKVGVTPELMDEIFAGVDELERMLDDIRAHGEIRTDPSDTIENLREVRAEALGVSAISVPDNDALDEAIAAAGDLSDEDHDVFHVRLAINEADDGKNGSLVVTALTDAFDVLGTVPEESAIDDGAYDGSFDVVFGSAVGDAAISAALDPVDAVADAHITEVTARYADAKAAAADPEPDDEFGDLFDEEPGSAIDSAAAQDMTVDDLLSEFDEYDDLDSMVEEIDDVSGFDDLGDAGSFHDLDFGDETADEALDADDGFGSGMDLDDDLGFEDEDEAAPEPEPEPAAEDPDEEVDDAAATFAELKAEVDPVGFDELQAELDELEFDEYSDEEEVGFDELLGEDFEESDDDFFAQGGVDSGQDEVSLDELVGDDDVAGFEDADDSATDADAVEVEVDADADTVEAAADADAIEVSDDADTVEADTVEVDTEAVDVEADAEAVEAGSEAEPVEADAEPVEADAVAESEPPEVEADAVADETETDAIDVADSTTAAVDTTDDFDTTDEFDSAGEFDSDTGTGFDDPVDAESSDFGIDVGGDFDLEAADPTETSSAASNPDLGTEETSADEEPAAAADADAAEDSLVDDSFSDDSLTDDSFDDSPAEDSFDEDSFDESPDATVSSGFVDDLEDLDDVEVREFELDDPAAEAAADTTVETDDGFGDLTDDDLSGDANANAGVGMDYGNVGSADGFDDGFDDAPTESETADAGATGPAVDGSQFDVEIQTLDEADEDDDSDIIQSIRVDVDQVENLLNLVEGLVTSRVRLRRTVDEGADPSELDGELDELKDLTDELQDTVMDVRLVPVKMVANTLPRVVRDIAREQDKQVTFEMEGESVELDRSILDQISDPLVHIVRNAVDHGIETPAERDAAGKADEGNVTLRVERARDQVVIEVEDDGRGLDADRLRDEAVEEGVLSESEAAELSESEAYELVFHPGLSTASEVTDVSGRGVGMDVVKSTVNGLDGSVAVESERGEGTTIRMLLPVTVAIADVLFVQSGDEEFGVPVKVVRDIGPVPEVGEVDGQEVVVDGDEQTPLVRLAEALETPGTPRNGDGMVLRIRNEVRDIAVHCDEVRGQQEVVVKPFEGVLGNIPGLSGATVLGEGEVVNILDVKTL
ncbi:Hpt domain-containing protein [Haloarchaeobius sp. DFWS5]|uniref:Hpt domain-containing protein n=1 Tax=Haloarchaeobius sp. DFWS5 TaxID=3446114 RepID=UPI003EBFE25D